jgi:peroxin-16
VTVMNQHIIATGPRHPNSSSPSLVAAVEETFPWPLLLSVVKETEVLVEMGAEYYLGRDHKWTPVATVETIKVLMRLLVLHKSGYKMLIDGGETPNVGDQPDGLQFDPALGRGRIGTAPSTSRPDRAMQAMLKYRANVGESTRPSWIVGHSSTVPPHTSNPCKSLRAVVFMILYAFRVSCSLCALSVICQSTGTFLGRCLYAFIPCLSVCMTNRGNEDKASHK